MTKAKKQNLESLIRKNIQQTAVLTEKVTKLSKELKRFQFMNLARFLLVVIPIILALLYLIPLFRNFLEVYRPILDLLRELNPIK